MAARFDAFISYSRAASSTLAGELRRGIERFAKPWYRLRSSRVFLDDASMSANTGLWSTIERGLIEAEWFILLCSPKAAESQYVTNEIAWWLQHKSADRILLVLDEGQILWDGKTGDFDWARATAVNRALSRAFAEEPRWVDLSWFELEGSLGTADSRYNERVADLAAAVRGIERDELVGENVRERRRAIRLLRGGVIGLAGLLAASLVATGVAVVNGNAAAEQARIAQARQLAAQAIVASTTDLQLASLLAVEAVRLDDDPQTEAALFQLQNTSPNLVRTLNVGSPVYATALAKDGFVVIGDKSGVVSGWIGANRRDLMQLSGSVQRVAVSGDHQVVVAVGSDPASATVLIGSGDRQELDVSGMGSDPAFASVSADGRYLTVGDSGAWTSLYENDGSGFTLLGTTALGGHVGFGDGEFTVFDGQGQWQRVRLSDDSVIDSGRHGLAQVTSVAVSGDGSVVAGTSERTINYSAWYAKRAAGADDDSPADLHATSAIAGALDLALDSAGTRLATQTEGAIYVSAMYGPLEPPPAPIALQGSGKVNFETLSFVGDSLVSGSGDYALVWDLDAVGRSTVSFAAPVPEGCNACGGQIVQVNGSGTKVVMTDQSAFSTVEVDLTDGTVTTLSDDQDAVSHVGAAWFDDDRLLTYSSADQQLLVLSGSDYSTVDLGIPISFTDGALPLWMRSDSSRGIVTVLDNLGTVQTVRASDGTVLASTIALAPVFEGPYPAGFDISPDQSSAYVWQYGGSALYVDLATGKILYGGNSVDGMSFDAKSRLHVFANGAEAVVDPASGAFGDSLAIQLDEVPPPLISPDARLVIEGGSTGQVTLHYLGARGAVLGRINVPVQDQRTAISVFTPDNSALVMTIQQTQSVPSSVRRVDLTVEGWIAASCAVAGRDMTPAEWELYVGTTAPSDLGCLR
ncbi:TIR domain-containing protein [soil metagenome]